MLPSKLAFHHRSSSSQSLLAQSDHEPSSFHFPSPANNPRFIHVPAWLRIWLPISGISRS
eukprot:748319-Hanusia_phi.AAC.14